MQAFFAPLRINFCDALSCFDLHLTGEHEPQVILGIYRQVLNQATPEVFTEVRHLIGQAFQRRDEPLELPPADAALPDFPCKGVPLRLGRLVPADHLVVPAVVVILVLRDPRVLGVRLPSMRTQQTLRSWKRLRVACIAYRMPISKSWFSRLSI